MTIEAELYNRATNHSGLNALISGRFEPRRLPEAPTLPACSYNMVGESMPARASGTDHGLSEARFQIDGWANDPDTAANLRRQIKAAFNRWTADGSAGGTPVQASYYVGANEPQQDDELRLYRVSLDFRIVYEG